MSMGNNEQYPLLKISETCLLRSPNFGGAILVYLLFYCIRKKTTKAFTTRRKTTKYDEELLRKGSADVVFLLVNQQPMQNKCF